MEQQYQVVTDGQGHYSLWPVGSAPQSGWIPTGWEGNKEAAMERLAELAYKPLPQDYLDFIKTQREIADRENEREGRPKVNWGDPEEERARSIAEERRRRRGE